MTPELPLDRIAEVCQRHDVAELALFGSALTGEFTEASDYDFIVRFKPSAPRSNHRYIDLHNDLRDLLGREIDLVNPDRISNPFRRSSILGNCKIVYAA